MRREKRKRRSQEWNALHFVLESIPSLKKMLWKKERKDSLTRGRKHTFLLHPFFLSLFFSSQPSSSPSFIHPLPPHFLSLRLSSSIFSFFPLHSFLFPIPCVSNITNTITPSPFPVCCFHVCWHITGYHLLRIGYNNKKQSRSRIVLTNYGNKSPKAWIGRENRTSKRGRKKCRKMRTCLFSTCSAFAFNSRSGYTIWHSYNTDTHYSCRFQDWNKHLFKQTKKFDKF